MSKPPLRVGLQALHDDPIISVCEHVAAPLLKLNRLWSPSLYPAEEALTGVRRPRPRGAFREGETGR